MWTTSTSAPAPTCSLRRARAPHSIKSHALTDDPFRVATGYHRIALDVMNALCSDEPRRIVINVRNHGAIADVEYEDVVEAPCAISKRGIVPENCGSLPEEVRGLVLAVKAYERAAIQAAVTGSAEYARKAMLLYPAHRRMGAIG